MRRSFAMLIAIPVACAAQSGAPLALKRITFYKSGVAVLQRSGKITPGSPTTITVAPKQMDYLLKSLRVTGSGGDAIEAVRFKAADWLNQRSALYPFSIEPATPLTGFLSQLPGAEVQLTVDGTALSGQIVSAGSSKASGVPTLLLFTSNGLENVDLRRASAVRLVNAKLNRQLTQYLGENLRAHLNPNSTVVLETRGTRSIRASYIQQAPVWKSAYRFTWLPSGGTLQDWAVINNDTNEDWNSVRISVATGSPRTEKTNLFQPDYSTDGSLEEYDMNSAAQRSQLSPEPSRHSVYTFPKLISLQAHHATMLAFPKAVVAARRAFEFDAGSDHTYATNVVDLQNTSANTLDDGVITVFDGQRYLGQGHVSPLASGARELIAYGYDDSVHLIDQADGETLSDRKNIHASHGKLTIKEVRTRSWDYAVKLTGRGRNSTPFPLDLIFKRAGFHWTIVSPATVNCEGLSCNAAFTISRPTQEVEVRQQRVRQSRHTITLDDAAVLEQEYFSGTEETRQQLAGIIHIIESYKGAAMAIAQAQTRVGNLELLESPVRKNIRTLNSVNGQAQTVQSLAGQLAALNQQVLRQRQRIQQIEQQKALLEKRFNAASHALNF